MMWGVVWGRAREYGAWDTLAVGLGASLGARAHLGAVEPCRDCGWRGVIGVLSILGAHWEDILACVLCMAECVMYVGGELGSIRKRGEATHVVWVHCFVCACRWHAWYVRSGCIDLVSMRPVFT